MNVHVDVAVDGAAIKQEEEEDEQEKERESGAADSVSIPLDPREVSPAGTPSPTDANVGKSALPRDEDGGRGNRSRDTDTNYGHSGDDGSSEGRESRRKDGGEAVHQSCTRKSDENSSRHPSCGERPSPSKEDVHERSAPCTDTDEQDRQIGAPRQCDENEKGVLVLSLSNDEYKRAINANCEILWGQHRDPDNSDPKALGKKLFDKWSAEGRKFSRHDALKSKWFTSLSFTYG